MDRTSFELAAVEETQINDVEFLELNDLQLALIGGGSADPLFL